MLSDTTLTLELEHTSKSPK